MQQYADKTVGTAENDSSAVQSSIGKSALPLVDNRPLSVVQRKPNNTGLPDQLKSGIENLSGYSLDDVKVHYNSEKPAQLNAYAYAQGTNIHVASGQEKHLPHEAWHVVQQKQGRVQATKQLKSSVNINDDKGLEKEADVMGQMALRQRVAKSLVQTVQRVAFDRVMQMVKPGDEPPSLQSQLHERFRQMSSEEGITEQMIFDKALALMQGGITVAEPEHPLEELSPERVAELGIKRLLKVGHNHLTDTSMLKGLAMGECGELAIRNNIVNETDIALKMVIDTWMSKAQRELHLSPRYNKNEELRSAVAATTEGDNQLDKAAGTYLADHDRKPIRELSNDEKPELIKCLRSMPVVQAMLAGKLRGRQVSAAHLLKGIEETGNTKESLITSQLVDRIAEALSVLGGMVRAGVLPPQSKVPNIQVNPDPKQLLPVVGDLFNIGKVLPYRANANRDDNKVRISAITRMDTIVHEFGHQIEFFLPLEAWLDIQQLLRMRHRGKQLIPIYPDHKDEDVRNEAAFNAEMPATGAYSAKVYGDGSTEVMSMTLEYFSTPENAVRMIHDDPLQAALILRIIQPVEFYHYVDISLRSLLPRGDVLPGHFPGNPAPVIPGHQQAVFDSIGDEDL